MNIIEIDNEQLDDLKMFLERSEMRGFEVTRFMRLASAISSAKPKEPPKKEVEEK